MTEEGVVVTSVEVMLWFPLMPGEDPAACCVLNKKHQLSKTRSPAPEVGPCLGVMRAGTPCGAQVGAVHFCLNMPLMHVSLTITEAFVCELPGVNLHP